MAGADDPTTPATPAAPTTPPVKVKRKRKPRICARVNVIEMKKNPSVSRCQCDHWEIRKPDESYGASYGMGNLCRRDYGVAPFKKVATGSLSKKDPLPKKKR